MAGTRAYALAVVELRDVVGASGPRADALRAIARRAFPPPAVPSGLGDRLGPLYRRVPGAPVVRPQDPTARDLEDLLAGAPVAPARSAAAWRLVEAFAAGLAWSATVLPRDLPPGLLAPAGLPLPARAGLTVGWCALEEAAAVETLRGWLAGSGAWATAAGHAGRPAPDVVAFAG